MERNFPVTAESKLKEKADDVENGGDGSGTDRACRVCHMGMDKNQDIELGCACKADLALAHRQCAETWFKIKGNRICEICGSTARNVVGIEDGEVVDESNEGNPTTTTIPEERNSWPRHRLLNFLLACIVFAFVISWLFHFSIPS
jgi:hypothetical protein